LTLAVENFCDLELVERLLRSGLNVNAVDKDGQTALMIAAESNAFEEIAKLLLRFGADIDVTDNYGCTALMAVMRHPGPGYRGAAFLLQSGANVTLADNHGVTVLMKLIRSSTNLEGVKLLLQFGANVNVGDDDGTTALMTHVQKLTNGEVVKFLLQSGANVDAVDIDGETAAMKVVRKFLDFRNMYDVGGKYLYLWSLLKKQGYSAAENYAMLPRLRRAGYKNVLRILLSHGMNEQNRTNLLALAMSYEGADDEVRVAAEEVKQMLSMQPDVLSAMTFTSREKEDLDLLHDCFRRGQKISKVRPDFGAGDGS
jgi:ankyrin repeat protein